MYKTIKHIIILLHLAALPCMAQTGQHDSFESVYNKYKDARFSTNIIYKFYLTYTAEMPIQTEKMHIYAWGANVHMTTEKFEIIRNNKEQLYVNKKEKLLMLESVNAKQIKQMSKDIEKWFNLDSVLAEYGKIKVISEINTTKVFRLSEMGSHKFAYIDIEVNTASNTFQKITVYFSATIGQMYSGTEAANKDNKPKMVIEYSNTVFLQKPDNAMFSLSKYYKTNARGKKEKTEAYKDFEFADYTKN